MNFQHRSQQGLQPQSFGNKKGNVELSGFRGLERPGLCETPGAGAGGGDFPLRLSPIQEQEWQLPQAGERREAMQTGKGWCSPKHSLDDYIPNGCQAERTDC